MPGITTTRTFGLTTWTISLLIATAHSAVICAALLLCSTAVCAQQLSIRRYDISDGLAHNIVTSIYQDAKGYLWFGTFEGLSRFDGYHFTNYSTSDGLSHAIINHVTEDRQGHLWAATNGGGVARLIDDPRDIALRTHADAASHSRVKFITFSVGNLTGSNQVNRMLFDSNNRLWCLTDWGVYRADVADGNLKFEAVIVQNSADSHAMLEDRSGRLWFGVANELIEVSRNQVIRHGPVGGNLRDSITGIIEDRQGGLLVAHDLGLHEFIPSKKSGQRGEWRSLPLKLRTNQFVVTIFKDSAGILWLGTGDGLLKYKDGQQTEYTTAQGLSANYVRTLAEDLDGNLWMGTNGGGACRFSGEMFLSYTQTEGLPNPYVTYIFEGPKGQVEVILADTSVAEIFSGKVSLSKQLDYPPVISNSFSIGREVRQTWWWEGPNAVRTRIGKPVLRLRSGREIAITEMSPFRATARIAQFYEDETGKVWLNTGDGNIYRTDATRPGRLVFESFSAELAPGAISQIVSDRAGGLWIGGREELGRLTRGEFVRLLPADGLPEIDPRNLFVDSRGWLWIGLRYKGVSMTKEPGAKNPKFINYSTEQGLSSGAVRAITEDDFGRLYFGTDKGLDRLDPHTGRWQHYTSKNGLVGDAIVDLHKDRQGNIWVATSRGLSKFDPRAERPTTRPAPIYFSRVNVAGEDLPLPETGATQIPQVELASSRNSLLIEYVGLSFQGEDNLSYQYQLLGVEADWSAPTKNRSINYGRQSAGTYRFFARAITEDGSRSSAPAVFEFRILPPVYQRWWFLSLTAFAVGLVAYALYRYRVSRLIELERVRTRIAADLHDDIGANLTKIGILSEVVRQQMNNHDRRMADPISSIGRISRESVASMSDIVWAINPRRDSLRDLTRRMREFAGEIFANRDVEFELRAPPPETYLRLGADVRRTVFLIFKEAVNNIVRHSDCNKADIELGVEGSLLVLTVSDDGKGFDTTRERAGNGLVSMRNRAASMGGKVEIVSREPSGTRVTLRLPIKQSKPKPTMRGARAPH